MGEAIKQVTEPFISIGLWQVIATLANTLILFFIIKKLFFNKVKEIIEAREKEVDELYNNAENAKSKAETMEREYTKKLNEAKSEATEIIKSAQSRANIKAEEIVNKASDDAKNITHKASVNIEAEKQKATQELKSEIADIAVQVASKIIEKEINKDDHNKLVQDFIESVGV